MHIQLIITLLSARARRVTRLACANRRASMRLFPAVEHLSWEKVSVKETPAEAGQNLNLDPPSRN